MDTNINYTIVQPGDRLDTLAVRIYGDPNLFELLIMNNPTLDIFNPVPGTSIKVVNA